LAMSMDRVAREERFHDEVSAGGRGPGVGRFYSITEASRRRFRDLVLADVQGKTVLEYDAGTGRAPSTLRGLAGGRWALTYPAFA
jgi:hypothetical protein